MPENDTEQTDAPPRSDMLVTDLEIKDGRVTIPARKRDMYDIAHRDVVNVVVYTEDNAFLSPDLPVDGSGRVRIPERQRRIYGVEDGDVLDIEVETTELTLPEE